MPARRTTVRKTTPRKSTLSTTSAPAPVQPSFKLPLTPILVALLIVAAFAIGFLSNKLMRLEDEKKNASAPTAQTAPQAPKVELSTIKALFNSKNLAFGDKNSKNLIVEVADPSCPYCGIASGLNPELNNQVGSQFKLVSDGGTYVPPVPEIKKLLDSGKAAFVYIYTPGHGNGELGTKALYCANEQGKFWDVHERLMSSEGYNLLNNVVQNDVAKSDQLTEFLSGAVDAPKLKTCIDSGKYNQKLTEDQTTAASLGIRGTPGFYINTNLFAGAYSWTDMKAAIK